jgi:hypothetical protein
MFWVCEFKKNYILIETLSLNIGFVSLKHDYSYAFHAFSMKLMRLKQ